MQWKVGEFVFDEGRKLLQHPDGDVVLEPKPAALLAFFCQHPGRNIGRDELLEAVWYGQIVSDNSINRVIVLLRKALRDEDKVRRYIATVPKLGYNFIADVSSISSANIEQQSGTPDKRSYVKPVAVASAFLALASVLIFVLYESNPVQESQHGPSVVPLSRLAVAQSDADLSSDEKTLVYSAGSSQGNAVFLISDEQSGPIQISTPGEYADYGKWANLDEFVVYLFQHEDRCEFHKVEFQDGKPQPATVIYHCNSYSFSEFSFSPDNSKLYFIERATGFSPYVAFELDLVRQSKRRLSQPVARGIGNHFIDVHPDTGKLLLLSDQSPGKTSVYELDPVSNSFSRPAVFDYSLSTAIWSHKPGFIVHPSTHPSYQLLETNLDSGASEMIVSDSRRISSPRRIHSSNAKSRDYLFTSYLYNRDIELSSGTRPDINSTVMDYLPSLSHDGERLAFISKRSGYSQIWIKHFRDDSLTAIEPQDKGRLFFSLKWSEDDHKILANTNTGMFVYDFDTKRFIHEHTPALPAYAVSWHSDDTLSYSLYDDQHWHLYHYSLSSGNTSLQDQRWAFSVKNGRQHILVDQQLNAFRNGIELHELEACASPVWRYQLRYQLDGEYIYCFAADNYNDLLRFDIDMIPIRVPDVVSRYEYFSVVQNTIAKTVVNSSHSDIMRTESHQPNTQ